MSTRPDDRGFTIRAYRESQRITIDLGYPSRFLALTEDEARGLAEALLATCRELKGLPAPEGHPS